VRTDHPTPGNVTTARPVAALPTRAAAVRAGTEALGFARIAHRSKFSEMSTATNPVPFPVAVSGSEI
jgi:hypothetical protein